MKPGGKNNPETITHYLLHLASQGVSVKDFLRSAIKEIISYLKCDAAEISVREKGKSYFCVSGNNHGQSVFFSERQKGLLRDKFGSSITLPLIFGGEEIGTLKLKGKTKKHFNIENNSALKETASILGIALAHRRIQVDVRERVKELVCLYGISKAAAKENRSLEEILIGIVNLLPPGWLYPEAAEARIEFDGISYKTKGYKKTKQIQSADIFVKGEKRGVVELVYIKEMPENDIGPFLNEEFDLIDGIAKELGFIIERKLADQEKLRLQEQLRHADRLATIGKLAAGIAHELNEPIGNILGFAQLLKKGAGIRGQALSDLEKIINASLYSRDIIRQLLIFARMMPVKMISVDMNSIVIDAVSFLETRCKKEGIKIVKKLSANLAAVKADPSQITQIIVNLVVNAIDAMPGGGKLLIESFGDKNKVSLAVQDNGIGMTEEVKKQIYLPFFTTKEVGQGTGLGLSVVHGIIESHKGNIEVFSEKGKGSRFVVTFPAYKSKGSHR